MLTLPPGPDLAPFHDRQIAVLSPKVWADWLYLDGENTPLKTLPAGALSVTLVRSGKEPPSKELLERAANFSSEFAAERSD